MKGLSRMRGNSHVRFLGEGLAVMPSSYPIHALREEGDLPMWSSLPAVKDFYPRPPRGGRLRADQIRKATKEFLSTPSARRATSFVCKATKPL